MLKLKQSFYDYENKEILRLEFTSKDYPGFMYDALAEDASLIESIRVDAEREFERFKTNLN